MGVDAAGDAVAVWAAGRAQPRVAAATLAAGAGRWSAARVISGGEATGAPVLAVGSAGDAVVAWARAGGPGVTAVSGRLPGRLGRSRAVSATGTRVAAAAGGGVAALVIGEPRAFRVAVRTRRGGFAAPVRIAARPHASALTSGNPLPAAVIDRTGAITVIWALDTEGVTYYDGHVRGDDAPLAARSLVAYAQGLRDLPGVRQLQPRIRSDHRRGRRRRSRRRILRLRDIDLFGDHKTHNFLDRNSAR